MWCRNHLIFDHIRASAGLNTEVCMHVFLALLLGEVIIWLTVHKCVLRLTGYGSVMAERLTGYIFSCDQAALWMVQSVRPSVCLSVRLSVCHTFLTMFPSSYHHEIFRSYYQWQKWRPCKRSRSEVKGQGHRGHNPTSLFPDCNSSLNSHMMMRWCI